MNCANKLHRQNYSKISYRDVIDWKTVNRYTVTHKCKYISRLDYVLRMLWVECNNVMQWGFITLIICLFYFMTEIWDAKSKERIRKS